MSKFMSHREMKAASRVLGNLDPVVRNLQERLKLMEVVVGRLLERDNLAIGIRKGRTSDDADVLVLIDRPADEPTPALTEEQFNDIANEQPVEDDDAVPV